MNADQASNDDSLSQSLQERIDVICDRFEAAWKADKAPRIEEFLDVGAQGTGATERDLLVEPVENCLTNGCALPVLQLPTLCLSQICTIIVI